MPNVYEIVNNRIVELLEKGTVPWRKPWNGSMNMPRNLASKKEYRGVNVFLLNAMNYSSPYWLSYNQCREKGGTVRRGEKASIVVFWKLLDRKQANDAEEQATTSGKIPLLRYYSVFNTDQCDGLYIPATEETVNPFTPIEEAEKIIKNMPNKPTIIHGGNRACYSPSSDIIELPSPQRFDSPEEYYSTLNHEAVHSTMHESRLNRKAGFKVHGWGDEAYSQEELCAEMGSAFLCGFAGIENRTIENSAAYIQGWLKALKNDKKMLVVAAAQAQKAADYILNRQLFAEEGDPA